MAWRETPIEIAIDLLVVSETLRVKGVNEGHVRKLAEAQNELPPILVDQRAMRVIDGIHRLAAAKLLGKRTILVSFFTGSEEEAFFAAVRANSAHGLPLSLADRKAAAGRVARMCPDWSDRKIAGVVGVSPKTVGALRKHPTEEIPQSDARLGRDGRVRRLPVRPAGIEDPAPRNQSRPERPERRLHGVRSDSAEGRQFDTASDLTAFRALSQDPSLRMTASGRFLLVLFELHIVRSAEWKLLSKNIPAHQAERIASLANECATAWLSLAGAIMQRNEYVS